ncbi:MAG TPA: hypothetical protein VFT51_08475 [Bacillales bacterium]|nr:hypothetical protein [Bacillales bacterium]
MSDTFSEVRVEMEQIGAVYREIEDVYGDDVSVIYLDPRNHFSIAAYLLKQWKTGSIGVQEFCRSLFCGIRRGSFFYNGRWINRDQTLNKEKILTRVQAIREKGKM